MSKFKHGMEMKLTVWGQGAIWYIILYIS